MELFFFRVWALRDCIVRIYKIMQIFENILHLNGSLCILNNYVFVIKIVK